MPSTSQSIEAFLSALQGVLPANAILTGENIPAHHHTDWSGVSPIKPLALVRPESTEQISAVLKLSNDSGIAVVPQGGLTGLAGAAQPVSNGIVLSLSHFKNIEQIDRATSTVTVQAGATLQSLQEALVPYGLQFGVDLAPRGTCQIGGLLACNAGGLGVIQHGTMRAQVLGLEVVLANGAILPMRALPKNTTGYDLAQIFIGSEGTLGVIARAVLKILPAPVERKTAFLALPDFESALQLFTLLRHRLPQQIAAFEIMWDDFLGAVRRWVPVHFPFSTLPPLSALIDITGNNAETLQQALEETLADALEKGWITDAVIASSLTQAEQLWKLRESIPDLFARMKPVVFDLSLPIARIGEFQSAVRQALSERWPAHKAYYFGHIGDGNLHIIVDANTLPEENTVHDVEKTIYANVPSYNGSISAEHGIGVLKKPYLANCRSEQEIHAMRAIKQALDPKNIMNPGKIFEID